MVPREDFSTRNGQRVRPVVDSSGPAPRRCSVNGLWHCRRGEGWGAESARPECRPSAFRSFYPPLLASLSQVQCRSRGSQISCSGSSFQEPLSVARELWDTGVGFGAQGRLPGGGLSEGRWNQVPQRQDLYILITLSSACHALKEG